MTVKELEVRIKTLEETVMSQAAEIRTLKDIEAINKLQRAYGYYLEHWMAQEVIDLFSDSPEVSLHLAVGSFMGKTGIKRYFEHNKPDKEILHQLMQLSGIVMLNRMVKQRKAGGTALEPLPCRVRKA